MKITGNSASVLAANTTLLGRIIGPAGSASASTYALGTGDEGMYRSGTGRIDFAVNGGFCFGGSANAVNLNVNNVLQWMTADSNYTYDVGLSRVAANALGIGNIGNGQSLNFQFLTELTTIAAAATTDTAIQIPANAIVLAVSVRVTVAIPTAATFDVGIAGATTRYGTGISVALNTTNPGTNDAARFYSAATAIRFTPSLTPATNVGRVRTTIAYITSTPPTS